jgi:hypothetical protein
MLVSQCNPDARKLCKNNASFKPLEFSLTVRTTRNEFLYFSHENKDLKNEAFLRVSVLTLG